MSLSLLLIHVIGNQKIQRFTLRFAKLQAFKGALKRQAIQPVICIEDFKVAPTSTCNTSINSAAVASILLMDNSDMIWIRLDQSISNRSSGVG